MTDAAGEYTAPSLPTGRYTVKAELHGLQDGDGCRTSTSASTSACASTCRLELGAVEESVTVTGTSPLVQTSSSELGTTVQEEQIKTLPLNGRNFVNLTRTVPGVVRGIPGANIDGAGSLAWRASASFSANGQRPRDNNYMLDGVDNNETWLQTVVLFPSVDALDEFKLQTSTYSAEFGRSLGGVVNLQIKSGANVMHGSGFEFLRNDAFDANNFFNNRAGRAEAGLQPASVRRHDRRPDREGPDVLLLRLPGLPRQPGRDLPLDGALGDVCARATSPSSTASSTTRCTGQPFPGNLIPIDRFDPAARNILNAADSRAEHRRHAQRHRADDQQLPDQPDARRGRTTSSTSRSITC